MPDIYFHTTEVLKCGVRKEIVSGTCFCCRELFVPLSGRIYGGREIKYEGNTYMCCGLCADIISMCIMFDEEGKTRSLSSNRLWRYYDKVT